MIMSEGNVRLSKLRLEPNHSNPIQFQEYYGPPEGYTFWCVYVDGQKLVDWAQPFTAYDPVIELNGSQVVPIWGDGYGYVSVRQLGPYVLWCNPIESSAEYFMHSKGLISGEYFVFDGGDYTATINRLELPPTFQFGGNNKQARRLSSNLYYPAQIDPAVSLPWISSSELRTQLLPAIPSDDLALYRIPSKDSDSLGAKLLRRIKDALIVDMHLTFATTPIEWIEVEVGLDLAEEAECRWLVGKALEGYAIRFDSKPTFPVWLTSPGLSVLLYEEFFAYQE
jgi:hypothetical protein